MTTTITKELLSASTNGRPILVTATSGTGTTIHTATSTGGEVDEITLWASNSTAGAIQVTLQWGGTTSPDDFSLHQVPAASTVKVASGWPLKGGLLVRAIAGTGSVVSIIGEVRRIAVT